MNWKMIFQLSLFGLAMAIATVFWIPSSIEPLFWLVIFFFCAKTVAKNAPGKYFLHGFLISMVNSLWITCTHILLADTFLANRPEEAEMMSKMPMPDSPRLMMLMVGPFAGVIFGIILGLFCFIASRFIKKRVVA